MSWHIDHPPSATDPQFTSQYRPALVVLPSGDTTGATDTAAIQAKLDTARTAGGGVVQLGTGTFYVTLGAHPVTAGYACALTVGSKTTLQGNGRGATLVKLVGSQTRGNDVSGSNAVILNRTLTGGDVDITVMDLTIDGNAANQTHTHGGLYGLRVDGFTHTRVNVKNCRGTAGSGTNETFHFDAALSSNARYESCMAVADDGGSTASGFSANSATAVTYIDCHARNMSVANGFTHNACSGVLYVACTSVLNELCGFNSEDSTNVKHVSCLAGIAATATADAEVWGNAESLGNGSHGFATAGTTTLASYVDCTGRNNGGSGLNTGTGSTAVVYGGNYSSNAFAGLSVTAGSFVTGNPKVTGNTTTNLNLPGSAGYRANTVGAITAPTVPISNGDLTNPYPFNCMVYVSGGTVTGIAMTNGNPTGRTSGGVMLAAGDNIRLTYSAAPTWEWFIF